MKNRKLKLEYPNITLYDSIYNITSKYPNNIAYNYYKKPCNYKTFLKRIDYSAKAFISSGITRGDVVTICMPNTPEAVTAFYALNKIGAIANMIHPLSAENEIKYYLEVSNSVMIITINEVLEKIENVLPETNVKKVVVAPVNYSMKLLEGTLYYMVAGRKYRANKKIENIIYWGEFIRRGVGYIGEVSTSGDGSDIAAILYSSGTTGMSKGIVLTNSNFNALAIESIDTSKLEPKDSILAIMPIFHGFGLGICIHTFLYAGCTVNLIPEFNSRKFIDLIKLYKPTIIVGVPTLFEALMSTKRCKHLNLNFLRIIISGGDSLPDALRVSADIFLKEHNSSAKLVEGYGLTECVAACCLTPLDKPKKGCIGMPYPDVEIKITSISSFEELRPNEIGEICVLGPTVMKGYLNLEKETNDTLKVHKDGRVWLHTGDLGYIDDDGYLYFVQRLKRMIISSGYNIYPAQIEQVLNSNEYVLTSTVVGIPHPYKIQVPKAYIVLKDGIEPTKKVKDSIKESCNKNIAKYSMPREFEYRKSLPKTKVGKVDYKALEK